MKKLVKKIHHFTGWELAIEEVVVILITLFILAGVCFAGAIGRMPARVNIVQCGSRKDLTQTCKADARCCALLEKAGNNSSLPQENTQEDGGKSSGANQTDYSPPFVIEGLSDDLLVHEGGIIE